jgi:hypothetical protein
LRGGGGRNQTHIYCSGLQKVLQLSAISKKMGNITLGKKINKFIKTELEP